MHRGARASPPSYGLLGLTLILTQFKRFVRLALLPTPDSTEVHNYKRLAAQKL